MSLQTPRTLVAHRYKARFAPSDLLCRTCLRWVPLSPQLLAALDAREQQPHLCALAATGGAGAPRPQLTALVATASATAMSQPPSRTLSIDRSADDVSGTTQPAPDADGDEQERQEVSVCQAARNGVDQAVLQLQVALWGCSMRVRDVLPRVTAKGQQILQGIAREVVETCGVHFAAHCIVQLE